MVAQLLLSRIGLANLEKTPSTSGGRH
jgi:hypothetical protein